MITFTVSVDDKKSEKVIKAFFDALEIRYNVDQAPADDLERPLNKKEQQLFNRLKSSLNDIKKWEKGEMELSDARTFLNGLPG